MSETVPETFFPERVIPADQELSAEVRGLPKGPIEQTTHPAIEEVKQYVTAKTWALDVDVEIATFAAKIGSLPKIAQTG